jgi:hypothetical protein
MIGVGNNGGVYHDSTEGMVVRLFLPIEPGIRRLVVWVHIGDDLLGVSEDIFSMELVYPCAVDAASCPAVGPVAAFDSL